MSMTIRSIEVPLSPQRGEPRRNLDPMNITIHPVTTIEECRIIEQLQVAIWAADDREVTPDHVLFTVAQEGGLVLLALTDDNVPVGFTFGFPGLTGDRRLKLVSHQTGVSGPYQSRGVGYQLKLAQREAALSRNFELITWTFDPLQARNARLNLRKLGAVCRTYLPNLYGEMRDELNQGLPSDRFKVEWWIATGHVVQRITGQAAAPSLSTSEYPILNPATLLENGLLEPAEVIDDSEASFCLVEIPANLDRLKTEAPDLALRWRLQTRHLFETAFAAGYTAVDLLRQENRVYYLLQEDITRYEA